MDINEENINQYDSNGNPHGTHVSWREKKWNLKSSEFNYDHGRLHGVQRYWYLSNGGCMSEIFFVYGESEGEGIEYSGY
jgi:antitoxin component YwqK of YwqJK toxin-antitoxin module